MEGQFGLSNKSLEIIYSILASVEPLDEAIIFGSRAKGSYKPGSDIDLALKGEKLSHDDLANLYGKFDDSLLPYTFDLLIFNDKLDKEVREHIIRVGKVFYQRPSKVMKDEKLVRPAHRLR